MDSNSKLAEAVAQAQRHLNGELPAPGNEANTCDWIIRPILVALGYENHEISAQSYDTGKYPDYTIMPGTDQTWYLEAKAWSVPLESSHVDQALNYAHSSGSRWVVLSNGQEWRLYDDFIPGKSADRLVETARLQDAVSMVTFLTAITRHSISSNNVANFAAEQRIRRWLEQQLSDESGPVISSLVKVARAQLNGLAVSPSLIHRVLSDWRTTGYKVPTTPPVMANQQLELTNSNLIKELDNVVQCSGPNYSATGVFENGGVRVLKGSRARREPVPSNRQRIGDIAHKLEALGIIKDLGDHWEFITDYWFKSPSGAAVFILARPTNGWQEWRLANGNALESLRHQ